MITGVLKVETWPPVLYLAQASVRDYADAWRRLGGEVGVAAGWLLRRKTVISFADLGALPLQVLCKGDVQRCASEEWAYSRDDDRLYQFAELLRRTLVSDRGRDAQWHQRRSHMHFRATHDLRPRVVGRTACGGGYVVFGGHRAGGRLDGTSFYYHSAVQPSFRYIDGGWFCELCVGYCFTSDGRTESPLAESLLAGLNKLAHHSTLYRQLYMWERYLREAPRDAAVLLKFGELIKSRANLSDRKALLTSAPSTPSRDPQLSTDRTVEMPEVSERDLLHFLDVQGTWGVPVGERFRS